VIEYIFTYSILNEKVYAQERYESKLFELFSHIFSVTHLYVCKLIYTHVFTQILHHTCDMGRDIQQL